MSETMESARRWSGFVCPDCRFVFRVPRDHDGQGVVCPSCRRMLKIPVPGDRPPPLVVPLRTPQVEQVQTFQAPQGEGHRRRKKRSRKGEGHAWDSSAGGTRRSGSREKRQMFWMLVGGGGLFALILIGVLVAMLGGDRKPVVKPPPAAAAAIAPKPADEASHLSDEAFLAGAEPMARRFLDAKSVDEVLPLVRNPKLVEPRIRKIHPDGKITPAGMSGFNTASEVRRQGSIASIFVRTSGFEDKLLSFVETPEGIRIDWESWAGWSDVPWDEFLAKKPTTACVFRVRLSAVDYYNTGFKDENKWQSYQLEDPDAIRGIYGYAERGTVLASQLHLPPDTKWIPVMLSLKFPANATSSNQVIIDRFVTEGWVQETPPSP